MAILIGIIIGLVAGAVLAVVGLSASGGSRLAAARRTRQLMLEEARGEADALRREAQLEAKEESGPPPGGDRARGSRPGSPESLRTQERLAAREESSIAG
jgi:ribonuclease Y